MKRYKWLNLVLAAILVFVGVLGTALPVAAEEIACEPVCPACVTFTDLPDGVPIPIPLYQAGRPDKPILATAELTYSCSAQTLTVKVTPKPGWMLDLFDPSEVWVKVDGVKPPTTYSWGYTVTMVLPMTKGSHLVDIHVNVLSLFGGNWETAAAYCLCLRPSCPTSVELAGFKLTPLPDNGVLVGWETGNEIDNLGFNIGRGTTNVVEDAIVVNAEMIESQAFGSMVGMSYRYEDLTAIHGQKYWYWLEDIGADGFNGIHPMGWIRVDLPPVNVSIEPTSGDFKTWTWHEFVVEFQDPDGWQDIKYADLRIGEKIIVRYRRTPLGVTRFLLWNPDTSKWASLAGDPLTRQNPYGYARVAGISQEGETLRITYQLKFKGPVMLGARLISLQAMDFPGMRVTSEMGSINIVR